jgi:ring-1,2-phenylacetyl-CoA epoxidase subunit PaaC
MEAKVNFLLQIADNALVFSHRLNKYGGKAFFLGQNPVNINAALDLTQLAESIYSHLALGNGVDTRGLGSNYFVYHRSESEFFNCILVEQENENFASLMLKRFLVDHFHYYFFLELSRSQDKFLAGIAGKFFMKATSHLCSSARWMHSACADEEMSRQVREAIPHIWKYTAELFTWSDADVEMFRLGIGVDLDKLRDLWQQKVDTCCFSTAIKMPSIEHTILFGKEGFHSGDLSNALNEMQFLAHPASAINYRLKQVNLN